MGPDIGQSSLSHPRGCEAEPRAGVIRDGVLGARREWGEVEVRGEEIPSANQGGCGSFWDSDHLGDEVLWDFEILVVSFTEARNEGGQIAVSRETPNMQGVCDRGCILCPLIYHHRTEFQRGLDSVNMEIWTCWSS